MVALVKKVLCGARYICWRINLSAGGLFERISFRKLIVFLCTRQKKYFVVY